METKWNKIFVLISLLLFTLFNIQCSGQKTPIPSILISIGGVNNQTSMTECKSLLGKPLREDNKTYDFGPDGLEEGYALIFDSLNVTFIKFYGEIIMSNISVTGMHYEIKIADYSISIGDPVLILDSLINSNFNCEEITKDKDGQIVRLVFDVNTINKTNSNSNGSLSIVINEGRIIRVGIVFDEELT